MTENLDNRNAFLGYCECCLGNVSVKARVCPHCGHPEPAYKGEPGWMILAKEELAKGRKINAIKALRERLSLGLKEAKDLVEKIESR